MTDAQKSELVEKYIDNGITDSILQLTVQEIIYLYSVVISRLGKENGKNEEAQKNKDLVFAAINLRLMQSDKLYIAYHVITGYPYIDINGNSWMFSEEKFAHDAVKHYLAYGIPLTVKKLNGQEIIRELYELNRLGIEKISVDNGQFSTIVYRSDILREKELPEQPKNQNPSLMFSLLARNELAYASNGENEKLRSMTEDVYIQISSSQLLVPVKMDKHLPDGEVVHISEASSVQLAVMSNQKSNDTFIPVFTDWREFVKLYSKDEWNAVLMTYEMLKETAAPYNGFIINPSGAMYTVDKDTQKKIKKVSEK